MGRDKELLELGVHVGAYECHHVCANCFEDMVMKDFINSGAEKNTCDFCDFESDKPIAAPFVEVLLHIRRSLLGVYGLAVKKLPYASQEGGYIGETLTTEDVIETLGDLPNDICGELRKAIVDGLDDDIWCSKQPFSLGEGELLMFSWNEFCRLVKYHRRFFFLHEVHKDDELYSPLSLLKRLKDWCRDFGLVTTLPAGHKFYRGRFNENGSMSPTFANLGPPPIGATKSNRMSPSGIVMFYVSDAPETALREILESPGTYITGEFEVLRDIAVLDLANMPRVPSIFEDIPDTSEYDPRPPAIFLNHFAEEISRPIAEDDIPAIQYVPTQIITEYFRSEFIHQGRKIDGIRYRSARHSGHCSLVLFANQEDLVDGYQDKDKIYSSKSRPWIKLVSHQEWGFDPEN